MSGPIRTCVGCRRRDARALLVRVVARNGCLEADPRGALAGRGAHVHPVAECLEQANARKAWTRALKVAGPLTDTALRDYMARVPHPKGERE